MGSVTRCIRAVVPAAALLMGGVISLAAISGGNVFAEAKAADVPAAAPEARDTCAKLADLKLSGIKIVGAGTQIADAPVAGTRLDWPPGPAVGEPLAGLPAFCRVVGRISPERGSKIGFEVWMPSADWDGRLNGVGIGGFAGYIDWLSLSLALKAGQASVATNTGHDTSADAMNAGTNSAWAKGHPERVRDYGWRAIHLSAVAAKQLVGAFYGREPDHSYFVGCSGGGRQGLIEASRFPEDYDGIVSGAPAANFTDLTMAMISHIQAQQAPGAPIRPEQMQLVQSQVLRQCDARDGQADGLVADPRQCKFDVSKLACGTSESAQCFTPPQIAALEKIYAGPRDSSGRQLTATYLPSGSEFSTPFPGLGWDSYIAEGSKERSGAVPLAGGLLQDFVQRPFATSLTFNFDSDPAKLKSALADDLDASPDLKHFFERGGKLILWHGWADAAIPPEATIRYYDAMMHQSGPKASGSSELFMVPGVQHCMGGNGPWGFGQNNAPQSGDTSENSMVAALQAWVEQGTRPMALVGRFGSGGGFGIPPDKPERQRLLCAWPAKAVLRPGGDPDKAQSYSCTGRMASSGSASRD